MPNLVLQKSVKSLVVTVRNADQKFPTLRRNFVKVFVSFFF